MKTSVATLALVVAALLLGSRPASTHLPDAERLKKGPPPVPEQFQQK